MKIRRAVINTVVTSTLGAFALAPAPASAQEEARRSPLVGATILVERDDWGSEARRRAYLEVNGQFGIASRAVTGVAAGRGYDAQGTPTMGAELRFLAHAFDCGSCAFHHGPSVGFTWMPGPDFGTTDRYAWRHYVGDLAYAMRMEFPCMRAPGRRVFMSGVLGVTGAWADAGTGSTDQGDREKWNERQQFSARGDHFSLGWRLGANLDLHLRRVLLGFGFDLRQLYGIDTDHAQTFMLGAQIRVGFDAGLGG